MYTSSFRSPLRKIFLRPNCNSGQSKFESIDKRTLTEFNFAIGEKVSKYQSSHMFV